MIFRSLWNKLTYYCIFWFGILFYDCLSLNFIQKHLSNKWFDINDADVGFDTIVLGCKFETKVCKLNEICFEDNLFGTCQKQQDVRPLFPAYSMKKINLALLALEMTTLLIHNYSWEDAYTQCVINNVLLSNSFSVSYQRSVCKSFAEKNTDASVEVRMKMKWKWLNDQMIERRIMSTSFNVEDSVEKQNSAIQLTNKRKVLLSDVVKRIVNEVVEYRGISQEFTIHTLALLAHKLRHVERPFDGDFRSLHNSKGNQVRVPVTKEGKQENPPLEQWIWVELEKSGTRVVNNSERAVFVTWLDQLLHLGCNVTSSIRWRANNTLLIHLPVYSWINGTRLTSADVVSSLKNKEWRPPGLQIVDSGLGRVRYDRQSEGLPRSHSIDRTLSLVVTLLTCSFGCGGLLFFVLTYCKGRYHKSASRTVLTKEDGLQEHFYPIGLRDTTTSIKPLDICNTLLPNCVAIDASSWQKNIIFPLSEVKENEKNFHIDTETSHVLLQYLEGFISEENRLSLEWKMLCTYKSDATLKYARTCDVAADIINASFIYDETSLKFAYIMSPAAQCETVFFFWQMIWESRVHVILNLQHIEEISKMYWSVEGPQLYRHFEVRLVSQHVLSEDYRVRSFYIKNLQSGETRTVSQFHFLSWSEFTTPDVMTLLNFRRIVRKSFREQHTPLLVHCSDGDGRSGTYVLVDMLLNRISKGVKEINFAATLQFLRDQRRDAVKSMNQFEFAFVAVVHEINTAFTCVAQ